jgi:hypothetical protein
MDIVTGCENYLGWQPNPRQPLWKARSIEIAKLKRAIKDGPATTTIENLLLALEYSRRKRLPVTSPVGLAHRITEALALAYIPCTPCDVDERIREALQRERDRDDEHSLAWIYRLSRSSGPGRFEVLIEWEAAGRG